MAIVNLEGDRGLVFVGMPQHDPLGTYFKDDCGGITSNLRHGYSALMSLSNFAVRRFGSAWVAYGAALAGYGRVRGAGLSFTCRVGSAGVDRAIGSSPAAHYPTITPSFCGYPRGQTRSDRLGWLTTTISIWGFLGLAASLAAFSFCQ
ncbi:hypothetical protein [Trichothermofontia sp.]